MRASLKNSPKNNPRLKISRFVEPDQDFDKFIVSGGVVGVLEVHAEQPAHSLPEECAESVAELLDQRIGGLPGLTVDQFDQQFAL